MRRKVEGSFAVCASDGDCDRDCDGVSSGGGGDQRLSLGKGKVSNVRQGQVGWGEDAAMLMARLWAR